jgi:epoxyqueuosine reductase
MPPAPAPRVEPRAPSPARLRELLLEQAAELGLAAVGVTTPDPLDYARTALEAFLAKGFHGNLAYLARKPADRSNPRTLLPDAKAVVAVALRLPTPPDSPRSGALRGKLAWFSRFPSYQAVLGEKLARMARALATAAGRPLATRICADSSPILERPLAQRAGLGFIADSGLFVVPGAGTQVALGEVLVDLELEFDAPVPRRCRSCKACRKACPTGALHGDGVVEARRCVSYLNQRRGIVPRELRRGMGQWVFGCDVCQAVCPENAAEPSGAPPESPALPELDLVELAWATRASWQALAGKSRLGEADPGLVARNAVIALGNSDPDQAFRPLVQILREHSLANLRLHAAWAVGASAEARRVLSDVVTSDPDPAVREEARARLEAPAA